MKDTPSFYTCPLELQTRYSLFIPLATLVMLLVITYTLHPVQHTFETFSWSTNSAECPNSMEVAPLSREYYLCTLLNRFCLLSNYFE